MQTIELLIQNYLSKNSLPQVRQRGIAISNARHRIKFISFKKNKFNVQIQGDTWGKWYVIEIKINWDKTFSPLCSCAYREGGICKHTVAAFLYFSQHIHRNPITIWQKYNQYNSIYTLASNKLLKEDLLHLLDDEDKKKGLIISNDKQTILKRGEDYDLHASLVWKDKTYKLFFQKIDNQIHSTCSCKLDFYSPLCFHKVGILLRLYKEDGEYAFDKIVNWDKQKEKYLQEYGYTLEDDDVDEKFDFQINDYNLDLVLKDKSLIKILNLETFLPSFDPIVYNPPKYIKQQFEKHIYSMCHFIMSKHDNLFLVPFELGIYQYNIETGDYVFFEESELAGVSQEYILAYYKIKEYDYTYLNQLLNKEIRFSKKTKPLINNYLDRNQLTDRGLKILDNYLIKKFHNYLDIIKNSYVHYVEDKNKLSQNIPLKVSNNKAILFFSIKEDTKNYSVAFNLKINDVIVEVKQVVFLYPVAIIYDNQIFGIQNYQEAQLISIFIKQATIKINKKAKQSFFSNILIKVLNYKDAVIEHDIDLVVESQDNTILDYKVSIKEIDDQILAIEPIFNYNSIDVTPNHPNTLVSINQDQIFQLERNIPREQKVLDLITASHPDIKYVDGIFYLPHTLILKNDWFIQFFDDLAQEDIRILGLDKLDKIKYSHHRIKTDVAIKNGMDWFDFEMNITFGKEDVSLRTIQKAILSDKNYVVLSNGKYGVLPDSWLKEYSHLLKFGNLEKSNKLKLSKLYFNFIKTTFYKYIADKELLKEIQGKKEHLAHFTKINEVEIPKHLKNTLRSYQYVGVNWLHFLHEFNWGGCLADDMGLGKTLQILTFLNNLKVNAKTKDYQGSNLIVMPKTLIFNWVDEIKKFTPDLTYLIYGYENRTQSIPFFKKYDLVLISYNILVKDIKAFVDTKLNYVILDESQAIKNINSQRYKAVSLLKPKNKIVLSGTPIENNLLELYAQMNFTNPGIFNTINFFKKQYVNPIQKNADPKKIDELQKMIHPFICRRTKYQVAKDLPQKTESILYCEMDKEQEAIYNKLKTYYKSYILNAIETKGIERSGMFIIEGLLKLRQVCDSTSLLKEKNHPTYSIKLDMLINQIEQIPAKHKILVFSQFLGMLDLIKTQFNELNIPYLYLDGKVKNRKAVVDQFQNDESVRVFLISLKVGGIGLNLTAADYVYLIDPWWNPAIEQQAIDRIYRIGQTKNVFAYKMICKNSVEEKILNLQARKSQIASHIISSEESFIKNLSKKDISDLFS